MLGEDNPNVMLIGHERLFYNGLLGRACRLRAPGAFVIYASPVGSFGLSIAGGPAQQRRIATVRPYLAHRVTSASDLISVLMIEPESVADDQIRDLEARIGTASGAADIYARIDAAKAALAGTADCSGFASADFDRLFLGRPLAPRPLDERIERTIRRLVHDVPAATVTAEDCAREAELLQLGRPPPRGDLVEGVVIDDHGVVYKVPRNGRHTGGRGGQRSRRSLQRFE